MPIEGLGAARAVARRFVVNDVPKHIEETARDVAEFMLEKAIDLSPIQSGRFAASWRITYGTTAPSAAPKGQRSASAAKSEARAASMLAVKSIKFGKSFVLENATPYAPFVEYGSPTTEARYILRRVAMSVGGKFGKIS